MKKIFYKAFFTLMPLLLPSFSYAVSFCHQAGMSAKSQEICQNTYNLILNIINVIMGSLGIIAVAVLIFGGIRYVVSAGNEEQIKHAKSMITYAIIGLVTAILAFVIVNTISLALGG